MRSMTGMSAERQEAASAPWRGFRDEAWHAHADVRDFLQAGYTPEIRAARRSGVITRLPDSCGRGRIIGDCRRVAPYGVSRLVSFKEDARR
ncbi:pyruvate formate lyase family protein [Streptosporangium sp. G12]